MVVFNFGRFSIEDTGVDLKEALEFSRLSTVKTDECTLVPEFGIAKYCVMHDHILQHLVLFENLLNPEQIDYLRSVGLHGILLWAITTGKEGEEVTWKMANGLLREGLNQKIHTEGAIHKKVFYWFIRNIYYVGVIGWHKIRRWFK